jgi:hypothetical protein
MVAGSNCSLQNPKPRGIFRRVLKSRDCWTIACRGRIAMDTTSGRRAGTVGCGDSTADKKRSPSSFTTWPTTRIDREL